MYTLNVNALNYSNSTATMTSRTQMILLDRSPNSTLNRRELRQKSNPSKTYRFSKVKPNRDIPFTQFVIGALCFIFEVVSFVSPVSRSLLGPGVFCGFFLLQVAAFGVLTYFYDAPFFPSITLAANVLAALASVIGLSLCSVEINHASTVTEISGGESLYVATRCLIIICCIVGGLLSVVLAVLFFKQHRMPDNSWTSQTTSDTIELDKLKANEFPDCSVDGHSFPKATAPMNHVSISDISNISYIDQNHSRTPSGSYQGAIVGSSIIL